MYFKPKNNKAGVFMIRNKSKIVKLMPENKYCLGLHYVKGDLNATARIYGKVYPSDIFGFFYADIVRFKDDDSEDYLSEKEIDTNVRMTGKVFASVIRKLGGNPNDFSSRSG